MPVLIYVPIHLTMIPRSSLTGCRAAFAAANPAEISMRPEIIEKQKQTIYEFHEMGSEVLMSAHVQVELSEEQALALH